MNLETGTLGEAQMAACLRRRGYSPLAYSYSCRLRRST